jgi:iron complex transport system substrate-binding protein
MNTLSRRAFAALAVAAMATTAGCASSGGSTNPPPPTSTAATAPAGGSPSGSSPSAGSPYAGSPSAGSPAAAAGFPVTVHATNGPVTLTAAPKAIVSLSPTATETLFAIGAGSQVKAVDQDSDYPAAAPHTKLDAYHLDAEAVAAYHPDLVVVSGVTPAQEKQFAELHIALLDEPAATNLPQAYREITQLGQATGHAAGAATTIASMKRQIAALVHKTPNRRASYYYELDPTYYSVTSQTFIGRVLHLLGLHSIADAAKGAAAAGGYPQLSAEYILNADPDYVFLADTLCCHQTGATVAKRPGWATLAAVQHSRVVTLNDDIASRWGPRIVDLLRTVATAIRQHPTP